MDEKRKEEEARELTPEEIDETIFQEQIASGEYDEVVPEYYFSNPDPYAKVEPRPDDAPKRNFSFDENGNIIVKNLSAFWLPDVKIVENIGGTEYTVTGTDQCWLWCKFWWPGSITFHAEQLCERNRRSEY